ncbi:DNA-binding transcriptional regulator, FadR family [Chitinophaga rupis]|uniref:DNA-binding transcriptional regulator, FadR family n=1 Tax=Chitinophaga rupis TaxID=573321 RepID=A0A1H7LX11_9BACT|nr:GntR family transcriptional regulator [Chitinophaga rupis]SEL03471.1 DNA-binding transcriptional regulator, FadR family [Chitinophaga rupis]
MIKTERINRHSLADEVAQRLQQQISLGQYKPDEKLPTEPALMQEFGVGRSTIREAVRILVNAGVVRVRQGLGTFVEAASGITEPLSQRLKRAEFNDLNEVRQLLELKIAQKAALHRTAADIERIQGFLDQRLAYAKENKVAESIQADIEFHRSIAAAANNGILADLYSTMAQHMKNHFVRIHKNTQAFIDTHDLHHALLQSIIDQKPEQAWELVARITAYSAHLDQ